MEAKGPFIADFRSGALVGSMRIKDKVVVITGASSGIGRASAEAFGRKGARVVLAARREDALRECAKAVEDAGGEALVVPTDVTQEESVERLAEETLRTYGRIDVWVNNAAVTLFGRFEETPMEDYRQVIETNLFGYIHGARAAIKAFREQGEGVLINNASIVGKVGQPFTSAYVLTKHAIVGFSECLRDEMRLDSDSNIEICTLLPASIDTPIFQHGANFTGRKVKPMPPVVDVERVANGIVRLARRPRRELVVGNAGREMLLAKRIAPGAMESVMTRQVDSDHFEEAPAPTHHGNLFEPVDHWRSASGGWKPPRKRGGRAAAVAGAAVAGGALVTGLWLMARPRGNGAQGPESTVEGPADNAAAIRGSADRYASSPQERHAYATQPTAAGPHYALDSEMREEPVIDRLGDRAP